MTGESHKKVFVGNLNLNTSEDDLRKYFENFGEIEDCVIMRCRESGRSRGFGM